MRPQSTSTRKFLLYAECLERFSRWNTIKNPSHGHKTENLREQTH